MSSPPTCLAAGYGSTISAGATGRLIGRKPAGPEAAAALRSLHDTRGRRIIHAGSTRPHETHWRRREY
jgi:hypothetical protein